MSFYLPIVLQKYCQNPLNKNLDFNNFKGINTVLVPTLGTDVASKNYVDIVAGGGSGASTGSLPFSLTASSIVKGQFTNPSGDDIQFTAPTGIGKLLFTDINGINFVNSPCDFTYNSVGSAILADNTGGGTSIEARNTSNGLALRVVGNSTRTAISVVSTTNTVGEGGIEILHTGTADALRIENTGASGDGIEIAHTSSGRAINILDTGVSSGTNASVMINKSANGRALSIEKNASDGVSVYVRDANNGNDETVYLEKATGATGHVLNILRNPGSSSGNSIRVVHSGISEAIFVENRGTNASMIVRDQTSDTSFFNIDANGNVGIGTPLTTLTDKFTVNNSSNTTNFRLNADILCATSRDMYIGNSTIPNRPVEKISFFDSPTSDFQCFYQALINSSIGSSSNVRFSWGISATTNSTMNILPYRRRVGIGAITNFATPNATLEISPLSTDNNPALQINRATTATTAPLLRAIGSNCITQINNSGTLSVGAGDNPSTSSSKSIVMGIDDNTISSLDFVKVSNNTINGQMYVSDSAGSGIMNIRATEGVNSLIGIVYSNQGHEAVFRNATNINFGGYNYVNANLIDIYEANSQNQIFIGMTDNTAPVSEGFIYTPQGSMNLLSNNKLYLSAVSGGVDFVYAGDNYISDTSTTRVSINPQVGAGNFINLITQAGSTSKILCYESTSGASQQLNLEASVIRLQNNLGNPIKITNVAQPTANDEVANKAYVDNFAGGSSGFFLVSATSGNANNYQIINLAQATNSNRAVASTTTTYTSNGVIRQSLIDHSRPILNTTPSSVYNNNIGTLTLGQNLTTPWYYVIQRPSATLPFNINKQDAPVNFVMTSTGSFFVGVFELMIDGLYKFYVNISVGKIGSIPSTSDTFMFCYLQDNSALPTTQASTSAFKCAYHTYGLGGLTRTVDLTQTFVVNRSAGQFLTFASPLQPTAIQQIDLNNFTIIVEYLGRGYA